jgi:hypothetical protein
VRERIAAAPAAERRQLNTPPVTAPMLPAIRTYSKNDKLKDERYYNNNNQTA